MECPLTDHLDARSRDLLLTPVRIIAGREGLQGKDAEKAISEVKLAAGGQLAEEVHPFRNP
jgi:hypothetical protein